MGDFDCGLAKAACRWQQVRLGACLKTMQMVGPNFWQQMLEPGEGAFDTSMPFPVPCISFLASKSVEHATKLQH